jgi:hypothetical protein
MIVTNMKGKTSGTSNVWLGALYIGFAIAYFLYMRHRREHTGKQLLRSLGENSAFTMDVSDDELVTKLADSTIQHGWSIFTKALISKDLILLYQQNNSFSMFERSFFANEDMDRFKTMVRRHVTDIKEV